MARVCSGRDLPGTRDLLCRGSPLLRAIRATALPNCGGRSVDAGAHGRGVLARRRSDRDRPGRQCRFCLLIAAARARASNDRPSCDLPASPTDSPSTSLLDGGGSSSTRFRAASSAARCSSSSNECSLLHSVSARCHPCHTRAGWRSHRCCSARQLPRGSIPASCALVLRTHRRTSVRGLSRGCASRSSWRSQLLPTSRSLPAT